MKVSTNTQYTGRKARIGGICFDERGRLYVFVNYCPSCKGKVFYKMDEAKDFVRSSVIGRCLSDSIVR